jgi:integrase
MGVQYTKRGRQSWLITVVSHGERQYKTIRGTEADAKAIVQEIHKRELAGINVIEALRAARAAAPRVYNYPTLYDGVKAFIEKQVAHGEIRGGTGPSYLSRLRTWTNTFKVSGQTLGSLTIDRVKREHLGALIGAVKTKGKGIGTIDGIRLPIKAYYRWLQETNQFQPLTNPAEDLSYFVGRKREQKAKAKARAKIAYFTEDDGGVLIAECHDLFPRRLAFLLSGLLEGLRWGESVALERADFDLKQGLLHVQRTWSEKAKAVQPLPKDGEDRWVPLHPGFVRACREHFQKIDAEAERSGRDEVRLAFPNRRGKLDSSSGTLYEHFWFPLLDAAGLARRKYHATRHSFITWCLNARIDPREVAAWAGHASIQQLAAYDHVTVARSAGALASIAMKVLPS